MPMTANGLAKLLEELGELAQVAAKRLAYFHTSEHPDGAGDLNSRLEDEMADVAAACGFVVDQFNLNTERMSERAERKLALFEKWHADPDNGRDCFHAPAPPPPSRPMGPLVGHESCALSVCSCQRANPGLDKRLCANYIGNAGETKAPA